MSHRALSLARTRNVSFAFIACGLAAAATLAASGAVILDSRRTYIHTASADSSLNSVAIDLASLGISAGDRVQIHRTGDFDNGPQGDDFTSMIGVFSSSATLLPAGNLHRVPGAIPAGIPVVTGPTYFGSEPTDIPEDFVVSTGDYPDGTICITVPTGATHLFLAPSDSLYEDNSDPNGDYGYELSLLEVCASDLDGNSSTGGGDLGVLLGNWGPCPR